MVVVVVMMVIIVGMHAQNIITTFAGTGIYGGNGDGGAATSSQLNYPDGVSVDISGNVYIADTHNNKIRMVNSTGIITTMAGNGTIGGGGDRGAATSAQLAGPYGISVDISGNVYIADTFNHKIRMVTRVGIITTFAGTGFAGDSGDGGAAISAQLNGPFGVSVGISGNVYIADSSNSKIRIVDSTGIIRTFAGTGVGGSSGDGKAATSATLGYPTGVSVDISGNVYIADNNKIRMVNSTGIITTFAGTGAWGWGDGDGGAATSATFGFPSGVAVDISGNVYITDTYSSKIRKVNSTGIITTIAGTGEYGNSGDGEAATSAQLSWPYGVSVDISGNVYIADTFGNKIRKVVLPQGRVISQPTGQPSRAPTSHNLHPNAGIPTSQPSRQPSGHPTNRLPRISLPTSQPSRLPSRQPTRQPSVQPSRQPSGHPTMLQQNTRVPTNVNVNPNAGSPTSQPSRQPSGHPTSRPTNRLQRTSLPTSQPSRLPTRQPSRQPSARPTNRLQRITLPTSQPTAQPSRLPTAKYYLNPTTNPTASPTFPMTIKPTGGTPQVTCCLSQLIFIP